MKTLHTSTNASLYAPYATRADRRRAGGIARSATLRSQFRQRNTEAALIVALTSSNNSQVTVHSKFMVIDGESVETGSFNYTYIG